MRGAWPVALVLLAGCADPGAPTDPSPASPVDETFDVLDGGPNVARDPVLHVNLSYAGNTGAAFCQGFACYGGSYVFPPGTVNDGEGSDNSTFMVEALAGFNAVDVTLTWDAAGPETEELVFAVVGVVPINENSYRVDMKANATGTSPLTMAAAFDRWSSTEDGRPGISVRVPRTGPASAVVFAHDGQAFAVAGSASGVGAAADAPR